LSIWKKFHGVEKRIVGCRNLIKNGIEYQQSRGEKGLVKAVPKEGRNQNQGFYLEQSSNNGSCGDGWGEKTRIGELGIV